MKRLDLHGVKHEDVERIVENFLLCNDCPLEIVTGNSVKMQILVKKIFEKHKFKFKNHSDFNLGSFIVYED